MTQVLRGNWNYPTTIWAGPGRIAELAEACSRAGTKRPLIVTDEGLIGSPMIKSALAALKDAALFGGCMRAEVDLKCRTREGRREV